MFGDKLISTPTRRASRWPSRPADQDGGISGWLTERAGEWDLSEPDEQTMQRQKYVWNAMVDYWFRYFHAMGVLPAAPDAIATALADGRDIAVWPGGEVDSLRPWSQRDRAELAGRTGFSSKWPSVPACPSCRSQRLAGPTRCRFWLGDQLSRTLRRTSFSGSRSFRSRFRFPGALPPLYCPDFRCRPRSDTTHAGGRTGPRSRPCQRR
jgi:hypothetical protein